MWTKLDTTRAEWRIKRFQFADLCCGLKLREEENTLC